MRCILSIPNNSDSWKHTSIFQTFIPLTKKLCKLVVDRGSSINVISRIAGDKLGPKVEPHSYLFKVAQVDKNLLPIKEQFLVTLKLGVYSQKIYCEVLPMNIAHLLLGCPWLYDNVM